MYQKPMLQPHDLTTALASCTPVPDDWCKDHQGLVRVSDDLYVGIERTYVAGQCLAYPQSLPTDKVDFAFRWDGYLVQVA